MKCAVLLPVYNAAATLAESIESILTQDESDFEFLIIDDGSRDDSPAVIRSYAGRDPRIRAFFHERNCGVAATLNEGLREARSPLVARIDGDDIALPNRLSTQIRFFATRPRVAVAGSFAYHMGRTPALDRLVRLPVEHGEIAAQLPLRNVIYHPTVMLRRDAVLAAGGYRAEFRNAEDYDLWLRLSRTCELANIPVPLLRYRFSMGGQSLGRKWQQALFTRMAIVSYGHPEWSIEEVTRQASADLRSTDRDAFLFDVARGTIDELIALGLRDDAREVFGTFFRQLDVRRRLRLAAAFGFELFRRR